MHVYKAKEFAIASTAKDFLGEAQNEQCFSMFQASDLLTAEGLLPVTLHVRAGICVRCGGGPWRAQVGFPAPQLCDLEQVASPGRLALPSHGEMKTQGQDAGKGLARCQAPLNMLLL